MSTTVLNALGDMSSALARSCRRRGHQHVDGAEALRCRGEGLLQRLRLAHVGGQASACVPSASSCRAALATLSALRLITVSFAPARAKACAMPKLMPLEPPATNTWRLLKSKAEKSMVFMRADRRVVEHGDRVVEDVAKLSRLQSRHQLREAPNDLAKPFSARPVRAQAGTRPARRRSTA